MSETYIAKIITRSRPFLTSEGSTWVADAVYSKDGIFYTREVMVPNVKHGPFEIGEEYSIVSKPTDLPAEQWMIEIYKNPSYHDDVIRKKNIKKAEEYEYKTRDDRRFITITKVIIALLVIAIIGVILFTVVQEMPA